MTGPQLGGSLTYGRFDSDGRSGQALRRGGRPAVAARGSIRVLSRADLHRPLRRQLAGSDPRQPPVQAAGEGERDRDRRARAAGGVPQQRPARRHAGLGGAAADAALRRAAGPAAPSSSTANPDGYGVGARPRSTPASPSTRSSICARDAQPSARMSRAGCSSAICASSQAALSVRGGPDARQARHVGRTGRRGERHDGAADAAAESIRLRSPMHVRRLRARWRNCCTMSAPNSPTTIDSHVSSPATCRAHLVRGRLGQLAPRSRCVVAEGRRAGCGARRMSRRAGGRSRRRRSSAEAARSDPSLADLSAPSAARTSSISTRTCR